MKKSELFAFLMIIFIGCSSMSINQTEVIKDRIILGAEQLDQYVSQLGEKSVALLVNQTSTIGNVHLVDTLQALGVNIKKVFAPEHGFRGDHSAGAVVKNGLDEKTGLPVVSLYGKNKKPTPEMLANIDVIIFDIQDVGVRFYTYISTMHYVMEACAEQGKELIILDRPNPNGFYIDGPVLQKEYTSFIGMHPIPIVHGLTVAELALMIQGESWLKNDIKCNFSIVPCKNYTHDSLYQLPIKPSPNLPNMNSVYLYPYLGLFEGTNVSIGRGTQTPFQIVGRPGFEGNFSFTPQSMPGVSDHPKYEGKRCGGFIVNDAKQDDFFAKPSLNLDWFLLFYKKNTIENGTYFKSFIFKLMGNSLFKEQVISGLSAQDIKQTWQPELLKYKAMRKKYLLYP
ncbi:MAG: DUF1343 domain-containing protein [Bacteroidia bacterium]|nr:DUF1343 domain-containing protein [Bacteroidia bacterium]